MRVPGRSPNGDFTYGGTFQQPDAFRHLTRFSQPGLLLNNSEVIAILMDNTNPAANGVNINHVKNPQQTQFLNAHMSGDTSSPGVGTDSVYRDPWGNPYVISMDLNYDGMCQDAFYCLQKASLLVGSTGTTGLNGLVGSADPNNRIVSSIAARSWSGPPGRTGKLILTTRQTRASTRTMF